tara:strand:+ start:4283 stop:4519 length:237 start_codon:yes stop_codon:yes gene_type:complete
MNTKKRPPMVEVKLAITKAVLDYTIKLNDEDASAGRYFPNKWYEIVEKAIEQAYDDYPSSERGIIELELEKIDNAFKQ